MYYSRAVRVIASWLRHHQNMNMKGQVLTEKSFPFFVSGVDVHVHTKAAKLCAGLTSPTPLRGVPPPWRLEAAHHPSAAASRHPAAD